MKVWLHYVGKGLYTPASFRREAERYGVNRAVPISMIKSIRYGDVVLVAIHRSQKKRSSKTGARKWAEVFGCFQVTGLAFSEQVASYLEQNGYGKREGGLQFVRRRCGVYAESEFHTDSPQSIWEGILEGWEAGAFSDAKVFLVGKFIPMDTVIIPHEEFTRSYRALGELPDGVECSFEEPAEAVFRVLQDYIRFRTERDRREYHRSQQS